MELVQFYRSSHHNRTKGSTTLQVIPALAAANRLYYGSLAKPQGTNVVGRSVQRGLRRIVGFFEFPRSTVPQRAYCPHFQSQQRSTPVEHRFYPNSAACLRSIINSENLAFALILPISVAFQEGKIPLQLGAQPRTGPLSPLLEAPSASASNPPYLNRTGRPMNRNNKHGTGPFEHAPSHLQKGLA